MVIHGLHFASMKTCRKCGRIIGRPAHECAFVKGPRFCRICGKKLSNKGYERYKPTCPSCQRKLWREKERLLRIAIKKRFGGKCNRCGYKKKLGVLHFHHVVKRVTRPGSVRIKELKEHPERFELICANCHWEIILK